MKIKHLLLTLSCLVVACTIPAPEVSKEAMKPPGKSIEKTSPVPAATMQAYQRELALRISQINSNHIYTERPQALLRSVIVLKLVMNGDGKLLRSEIVRSNRDKTTENIALASIKNASPFPRPGAHLLRNGKLEVTETWLFNTDARFQLRTIALPQMSE